MPKNEITIAEPTSFPGPGAVQPHNEVATVLSMIERASKDPSVDVGKLEKLFELRERVRSQVAEDEYTAAMLRLQADLPVIRMQGRIDLGKGRPLKYAKWEDIYEVIKPLLAQHGFVLTFETGGDLAAITVTAILRHAGGHTVRVTTPPMPRDNSGAKSGVQGVGSTMSYGKRYAAALILNLTWSGEDDDGNSGRFQPITEEQVTELVDACVAAGVEPGKLALVMGVDTINEIPAAKFEAAKAKIASKRK